MQAILTNHKIRDKILSREQFNNIPNKKEYMLFSDNILEGLTLVNYLSNDSELMILTGVYFEPYDQPIYIFKDFQDVNHCIKICGSFDKWELPEDVYKIKSFVDLPDYIFYSLKNNKAILAGENTETASVGNSQWQREGRKVAAAKIGVPFIYQTFYSGKDESLNSIREPNSLQVYNQILYSLKYKTPSIVAYFENNFIGSETRFRNPIDSQKLFSLYIKSILLTDSNEDNRSIKLKYEKEFFHHMISYLKEHKYSTSTGRGAYDQARILRDFNPIDEKTKIGLLNDSTVFVDDLIDWMYGANQNFAKKYSPYELEHTKLVDWNPSLKAVNKKQLEPLIEHFNNIGQSIRSYSRNSKVGIVKTKYLKNYLSSLYPKMNGKIDKILDKEETLIFPIRIWKYSNDKLTLSPDPESGEIVAFCELFGYDINGNKKRNIFGSHMVDIPKSLNYVSVEGKDGNNKINKAIANYLDLLILSNGEIVTSFKLPKEPISNFVKNNLTSLKPKDSTEEVAVVSTFLNQSTIRANWNLCFIHTHHSSWQQIFIDGVQQKINRVSTKIDLIMQDKEKFMLAEGKDQYQSILNDNKIKQALKDAGELIDNAYKKNTIKFDAFLYNLNTNPLKDPDFYADREQVTVKEGVLRGHFKDIANHSDYMVIIVYQNSKNQTKFRLVFSPNFNNMLMYQLKNEFL
jgi:hypothetical protein